MQITSEHHEQSDQTDRIAAVYHQYLQLLLAGDRQGCRRLISALLNQQVPIKRLYLELFQRALYQVGDLWAQGAVSVAKEHLATAITESMLNHVYPTLFKQPRCGRTAVVACVANEYHQLGAKMVADIIETHGWDGYFLGANTPLEDLLTLLEEKQPDLLCLSISIHANLPVLVAAVERIRQRFQVLPIMVGGQAFRWGGAESLAGFTGLKLLHSLDELEQELAQC
jgi:methanogenic corrinoid protein MtbC1